MEPPNKYFNTVQSSGGILKKFLVIEFWKPNQNCDY